MSMAIEEDVQKYLTLASDVVGIDKDYVWINHYRDFIPSVPKLTS